MEKVEEIMSLNSSTDENWDVGESWQKVRGRRLWLQPEGEKAEIVL